MYELNDFKNNMYKNSNSITTIYQEYNIDDTTIDGHIYKSACQFNKNETTYIIDNIILNEIDINDMYLIKNSNLCLTVNNITHKKDDIYQIEVVSKNGDIHLGCYQVFNKNNDFINTIHIKTYHFYKKKENWGYILYYIKKQNNPLILHFNTYNHLNKQVIQQLTYKDNLIYNGDIILVDNIDLNTNRKHIESILQNNQYLEKFTTYKENINNFEYYINNTFNNKSDKYYGLIQFVYIDEIQYSNPVLLINPVISQIDTKSINKSSSNKNKNIYLYIIFFMMGYFTNRYML